MRVDRIMIAPPAEYVPRRGREGSSRSRYAAIDRRLTTGARASRGRDDHQDRRRDHPRSQRSIYTVATSCGRDAISPSLCLTAGWGTGSFCWGASGQGASATHGIMVSARHSGQ